MNPRDHTKPTAPALDTGNFVSDPLYLALDQLYRRGRDDEAGSQKDDPRAKVEWQAVLDLFRAQRAPEGRRDG